MKKFSLKMLFLFFVMFFAMGVSACGDSSNSSDAKDDCTEDPALCEDGGNINLDPELEEL